jgi:hypothetical protein
VSNGKKQKSIVNGSVNGFKPSAASRGDEPNAQLELETRQAAGDMDVDMTG